jgi:phospholipid-translocating ATPase
MSSKGSKSMAKRRIKSGVSTEQRTIYHNMMPPQDLFDKHGRYLPQYAENGIRTAKYNPLSFVPKNLFEQFRRLANFYFLGLIVIQCFPMFNIRPVYFAALPIVTIVIITAIKDGVEDLRRHTSDREINYSMGLVLDSDVKNSNYLGTSLTFIQQVYRELLEKLMALMKLPYRRDVSSSSVAQLSPVPSYVPPPSPTKLQSESKKKASWKQTLWKDIRVGDIIYLTNNETIPADIIVLSTSEPDCICYVETKNLDGETNLKLRNGYTQLSLIKDAANVDKLRFYAECEPPSSNLYTFNGALSYQLCSEDTAFSEPMKKLPITCNELLLRGCVLRNTKWVIGVVAFCGKETKLMMNSGDTPSKRSLIERQMNKQVLSNFALLVILCMIMGIMGTIAQAERAGKGYIYLPESNTSPGSDDYQSPSYFGMTVFWIGMILLQNLVPISLYITAEFMKTLQVTSLNSF